MTFFPFDLLLSVGLLVIMTVCVADRMLSSSVEYLMTYMYNSSIVIDGSKDIEWKKEVDSPKLLLKY